MFDSNLVRTVAGNYTVDTSVVDAYGTYETAVRCNGRWYVVYQTADKWAAIDVHNDWAKFVLTQKDITILAELTEANALYC